MAKTVEVKVPDIGDYQGVPVIEILVQEGQRVEKDAALLTLESEKATMEVPAPEAGTVRGIRVKVGGKVSEGDVILALETDDKAPAQQPLTPALSPQKARGEGEKPAPPPPSVPSPPRGGEGQGEGAIKPQETNRGSQPPWVGQADRPIPHASPMVRRVARDFGVDLAQVRGSGPHGRILQEDVQGFVKQNLGGAARSGGAGIPPIPAQDFAQYGEIETKPLSRIRKFSATHLSRAWLNIPHVTQHDQADITELEAFRKAQSEESGVKLTLLPIVMKAVSVALKNFPEFNASLAPDGENLILKKYCHIGFAADTEAGLVVPVVRDVWSKGIVQLANDCGELAKKARDGKLKPDEMKGGCFSISSLGGLGVTGGFTPIVNAPEVAILGVSRATQQPVWNGKDFAPRLMLPLSLSYDHRVIDGAYAARFTVFLVKALVDLRRTLL